jgi:hypothetical protein
MVARRSGAKIDIRRDTLDGPAMFRLMLASFALRRVAIRVSGSISDPNGAAMPAAPIQVKNKATGALARTTSKSDGATRSQAWRMETTSSRS